MTRTIRLDQQDSWLRTFEATVVATESVPRPSGLKKGTVYDGPTAAVILDQSAFYPESGGQKGDHGVLRWSDGEVDVVDTQIDEHGRVLHLVGDSVPEGVAVHGVLDAARRRAHMSLHTGQHMLSRALLDEGGVTVSSRLGAEATIDLDRELTEDQIRSAERRVQDAIDADGDVRVLYPTDAELAAMKLRRTVKVDDGVRVIEVDGFDLTPCGGTHCTRTAQVGVMRVLEWQRKKGGMRLVFAAGPRARDVLVERSAVLEALASEFTCGPTDVSAAVAKLQRSLQRTREILGLTRNAWARALAELLHDERDVVRTFDDVDVDAVRALAVLLTREGDRLVVLAARTDQALSVIVSRGPTRDDTHAGQLLGALAKASGGKGGGRPERAEGRLPADADLAALMSAL